MGPSLAGCGALCRRRRERPGSQGSRLHAVPGRVRLSRLGDSGVQQRHALRRVFEGATGGRPDGSEESRQDGCRHRDYGPRSLVVGPGGAGARPRRRAQRANRHGDARDARADGGLRALPRSQVRSDLAEGLLFARGGVLEHHVSRISSHVAGRNGALGEAAESHRRQGRSPRRFHGEAKRPLFRRCWRKRHRSIWWLRGK